MIVHANHYLSEVWAGCNLERIMHFINSEMNSKKYESHCERLWPRSNNVPPGLIPKYGAGER